ncbi:FKBP-type peptidyl-prolyl cis-trans isomerase [Dokdonella koreensis]|uniref:Peptidyl-prolyl cis-trans isomerase n=1 Tax=Dokdonella koreensis DS-123 TaxID=1300342 RepID=A0A167GPU5_9GAMM|nr:peptidylprolyl isomerase [Dokdonella koreensis]ANB17016.1 Peptidyl-prolyl cis-trans isomerase [Dokdonella koreensis DS-123]
MQVDKNKVVSFHYSVGADGEPVDSSRDRGQPLEVLIGHGGIIPGLENALAGRAVGDRFQVSVPPAEAYGERQEGSIQRVPKKYFQNVQQLRPGSVTALGLREGGHRQVTVVKVGTTVIDVDVNHPLAGRTLDFDIEITAIRDATPEEIAHRHVHGPGHAH